MKCIVKNCQNHTHQGKFVGDLCSPCYEFARGGEGRYSQLYRNTVEAEREACAKTCEGIAESCGMTGLWQYGECASAIRARGEKK